MIVQAVIANTLYIPEHSRCSFPVERPESSINSGEEMAGELEYIVFKDDTRDGFGSGRVLYCHDCPVAAVDNLDKGYKFVLG